MRAYPEGKGHLSRLYFIVNVGHLWSISVYDKFFAGNTEGCFQMEKNEFAHSSEHKMVKPNEEHNLKKFWESTKKATYSGSS